MKKFSVYLKEALSRKISDWIKGIFDVEIALDNSNRLVDLNIKTNELKRTEEPFDYEDYVNNNYFLNILKHKNIGFAFATMIINKPQEFLNINEKQSKPKLYCYFKTSEDNITYLVGICMFDLNVSILDEYITLIDLESVNFVKDNVKLSKIILNQFVNDIAKSNRNLKGIAIKPITNPHKSFLLKLGFKKSKDNANILIYDI